uniref:Secreted protein n=1 Tax=Ascaris lumbricoides TaxID=6252 RepID=A0A0M3I3K8_ASCLU
MQRSLTPLWVQPVRIFSLTIYLCLPFGERNQWEATWLFVGGKYNKSVTKSEFAHAPICCSHRKMCRFGLILFISIAIIHEILAEPNRDQMNRHVDSYRGAVEVATAEPMRVPRSLKWRTKIPLPLPVDDEKRFIFRSGRTPSA